MTNAESPETSTTELTAVSTTADDGSTVTTTIPAGALPAGSSVEVSVVSEVDSLVEQAPPPEGVDVTLAFSVSATDSGGDKLTDDFASPVTLTFTVDAGSVPDGAALDELSIAFWNGSEWVVVAGSAVLNSDGSVTLSATVDHFTLFAVLHRPAGFSGDAPAAGSIGLLVTSGVSTPAGLVRAFGDAGCTVAMLAVTESGLWSIFISGAPAQVNAAFPESLPATTPFFVRCA